jgi:hypothetical protein
MGRISAKMGRVNLHNRSAQVFVIIRGPHRGKKPQHLLKRGQARGQFRFVKRKTGQLGGSYKFLYIHRAII